jgi:hypothetical protein
MSVTKYAILEKAMATDAIKVASSTPWIMIFAGLKYFPIFARNMAVRMESAGVACVVKSREPAR